MGYNTFARFVKQFALIPLALSVLVAVALRHTRSAVYEVDDQSSPSAGSYIAYDEEGPKNNASMLEQDTLASKRYRRARRRGREGPDTNATLIQKEVQKRIGEELEARMKFYPGMTSAKQLLAWNVSIAGPRVGRVKELPKLREGPRILSMHDMASGYNELSDNDYLMMFRSWEMVDIFVYFSHVHIAVPPIQWTMTAHEHGRPALGTLIFEGDEGSVEVSQAIVEHRDEVLTQLVNLADHYGFDGWFFNNEGGQWDEKAGDPERFVGELRDKMHKQNPNYLVIAYPYGPSDKEMFDNSDGVFINYNWDESDSGMKAVVKDAGNRTADVYMGMDAFGDRRGNCEPDEAHIKLCAKHNLSAAIFGPGYNLEVKADKKYSQKAVDYDKKWWSQLASSFGRRVAEKPRSKNVSSVNAQ